MPSPPPSLQKASLVPRSRWGSARLPLWPIQTSGPLHQSPLLQSPPPKSHFQALQLPSSARALSRVILSGSPGRRGNRPVLCLAVSDMTPEMEMKPWIFIRRGRCPRRPGPGEEAGRGGSASQGEARANGGSPATGLRYPSIHVRAHIHTSSPRRSLPRRAPSTPALNCPCNELQWMGLLVWRHLRTLHIGGTSCRPSSPGNTFKDDVFYEVQGQKPNALPAASGLVASGPPQPPPTLPSTPRGAFCFPNYSSQRGGLRFETCGGGWGLELTHEAPEHPGAWDVSLWQDTCYFSILSILNQPRPSASKYTLTTHARILCTSVNRTWH